MPETCVLEMEDAAGRDVSAAPGADIGGNISAALFTLDGRCKSGVAIIADIPTWPTALPRPS
ncbi:hypothetical protein [Mycobacterium uberis]|uniref:hypothetical protein n=1 Tax=Mycobacterium uberis TaxID=2162698 RepID=UPI001A9E7182|nr:hypothetical protein [Mycobacterium uberis]